MAGQLQLGRTGAVPGEGSQLPRLPDTSEEDASPKRRRAGELGAGLSAGRKKNKAPGQAFDWDALKQLLCEQKDQIVGETRAQAHDMVKALDAKVGCKFAAMDDKMCSVSERLKSVEDKLARLEEAPRWRGAGDAEERRRSTLVIGGWNMDTPRRTILAEVDEALDKLDLTRFTDAKAFTTGPRRSVALLSFELRPGESEGDRRKRMHELVATVAEAKPHTSQKKRMWISYSRTKAEREIAAHCAWVKRTLASFNQELLHHLDAEYNTGTVWLGEAVVASTTRTPPEGLPEGALLWDDKRVGIKPWINIDGIARFSGITQADLHGIQEPERALPNTEEAPCSTDLQHSSLEAVGELRAPRSPQLSPPTVTFPFVGWNLGGASVTDYPQVVADVLRKLPPHSLLSFQEVLRSSPGWQTETSNGWTMIHHRGDEVWRGTGIAFRSSCWKIMRKKATSRGIWIRLRGVQGVQLWVGTAHFTPGCTQPQHAREVHDHLAGLQATTLPVLLSCDLNAEISWGRDQDGLCRAVGTNGKTDEFLAQCSRRRLDAIPPHPQDYDTPTSRPRQANRVGKQIDCMLATTGVATRVEIHKDSYMTVGTDHELLSTEVTLRASKGGERYSTQPRVWIGGPKHVPAITQDLLVEMGKECTRPRRSTAYRDPPEVKDAFREARAKRLPALWTLARNLRKGARKTWEQQRLDRATAGDWALLKQMRPVKHQGWDVNFADAQDGRDPHRVVHEHLQGIYTTGLVVPPAAPWEGDIQLFSLDELRWALHKGKFNKAVGVDGTSHELLHGLSETPGGLEALLDFYNGVYTTARIPEDWNAALMIVIPKDESPTEPSSLRPLAMGSAAAKVYSRLLLGRTVPWLTVQEGAQCSGVGKQPAEYIFGTARVMELEAEWHRGMVAAKIDIRKAFDMLHRPALLRRLKQAIGDGPTYRSWQAMLSDTSAVLQTGWGSSRLQLDRGIRQGSVESPILFAWLASLILLDVKASRGWDSRPKLFPELGCQDLLFMDDGLIWAHTAAEVSQRLQEWADELEIHGLMLNPSKCKAYYSPHCSTCLPIRVRGHLVPRVQTLEVMGVPLRVGATSSELLAPLIARGRDKFWALKHLFRARTPLTGRIKLLDKIIGGTSLWCLSALAPDASSLALLNSMQLQCVVWAMRVGKRTQEGWLQYKQRAFRGARQLVWNVLGKRWSTVWLERWWNFSGHRARGLDRDVVPNSSLIDDYRAETFATNRAPFMMTYFLCWPTGLVMVRVAAWPMTLPDRGPMAPPYMNLYDAMYHADPADQCSVQTTANPEDLEDSVLMQHLPLQDWFLLLEDLRRGLEALTKQDRAVAAVQLLRWLDFTATDRQRGYLLGHMGGKTADLLALLVSALTDTGIDPHAVDAAWGTTWVLEMRARITRQLRLPLREGCAALSMNLQIQEDVDSEANTTRVGPAAASAQTHAAETAGCPLPRPAPGDLAAAGLSMRDLVRLWNGWQDGSLDLENIRRLHGPTTAEFVRNNWVDGPAQARNLPDLYVDTSEGNEAKSAQAVSAAEPPQAEPTTGETKPPVTTAAAGRDHAHLGDDDTALLALFVKLIPVIPKVLAPEVPVVCEPTVLQLATAWVEHFLRQGRANLLLASNLLALAEQRGCRDYMNGWEDILLELGLHPEADMTRLAELSPQDVEVLRWIEAEMWDNYVDDLEEQVGWESPQVMDARGQHNMPLGDRVWWQARAQRGDFIVTEPERSSQETGDEQSLMERHRRRDSSRDSDGPRGRDRRPRTAGNTRSTPSTASGSAHDRSRTTPRYLREERCTTEVRRLEPRGPPPRPTVTRATVPSVSIDAATARWLYFLGLRDTPGSTRLEPALPRTQEQLDWINGLHEQDMPSVMTGFLRVMSMLLVEISQLLVTHQASFMVTVPLDEDDADDVMWMQGAHQVRKRPKLEPKPPTAADLEEEHFETFLARQEQEERERQQEQREQEELAWEAAESARAQRLWSEVQAEQYRDWEQWEVLNQPPPVPTRQRLRLVAEVAGSTSSSSTSTVPVVTECLLPRLHRGRLKLTIEMEEVGVPMSPPPGAQVGTTPLPRASPRPPSPLPTDTNTSQDLHMTEEMLQRAYTTWLQGGYTDDEVRTLFGDDTLSTFLAEWVVKQDEQDELQEELQDGVVVEQGLDQAQGEGSDNHGGNGDIYNRPEG
ncbi:unnamed protein product [Symbiodinium sp. CCMP2456]|nr:unnamed protein product [Symbiodinium sp. CCMP2456]